MNMSIIYICDNCVCVIIVYVWYACSVLCCWYCCTCELLINVCDIQHTWLKVYLLKCFCFETTNCSGIDLLNVKCI